MKIVGLEHVQLAMPAGEEDRAREFYSGVLGLIEVQKPLDLDDFIAAVRRIEDFWISFVRLPAA
jgi:catechol 2,3-dioxygenase-like lactoylglutathione lyase family enzyme